MPDSVTLHGCCPRCASPLRLDEDTKRCARCGLRFPKLGRIPIILPDPIQYLSSCRSQLEALGRSVNGAAEGIRRELDAPDLLAATRERCEIMAEAMETQVSELEEWLGPTLQEVDASRTASEGRPHSPANLESLPYLIRDWGGSPCSEDENERSLMAVGRSTGGVPLGRTLVMGAGACRLSYDLHQMHPEAELVALDIDPILMLAAERILSGDVLSILESSLEVTDLALAARRWELRAPDGPADRDRLRLMVADALAPPFQPEAFETVLTPWFIDQGPSDLRDLVSTVHRMLVPGGRWLNIGPLRYEPEVPVTLRFSRDEILDLLGLAGFRVDHTEAESIPYLVSPLNGRGKVDWVMTFAATRVDAESVDSVPRPWLVFRHLPVPKLSEAEVPRSSHPLFRTLTEAIDGKRTLDDLTTIVASEGRVTGLDQEQLRQAVRLALGRLHPEVRS